VSISLSRPDRFMISEGLTCNRTAGAAMSALRVSDGSAAQADGWIVVS
jgi:hypothetical protein